MLIQETINQPDVMLNTYASIDDKIKHMYETGALKQLPLDGRGRKAQLSVAEIITMLVMGAWRGLVDKAKLYYFVRTYHIKEFPSLPSYSKFVEATNRVMRELAGLLAQIIGQNRQAQGDYPIVFQDSTNVPVCKVARAKQHKTFRKLAHKSKTGSGWYYGFKLHAQCDSEGRLCGFRLTTANTDDRKLLEPLTQWMANGIVVGDKGYLSQQIAYELGSRNVQLITGTRQNMKRLASPFQIACLQARHRIEEVFEFLKCSFGLIRSTHRADFALPLHFMVCLLAYSLYKLLIA